MRKSLPTLALMTLLAGVGWTFPNGHGGRHTSPSGSAETAAGVEARIAKDREDISLAERAAVRRYWESLCTWLVLNPAVLKSWAGVDVVAGRIHRVIKGLEVWEEEPTLRPAYAALYNRVCILIVRNRALREALVEYGGFDLAELHCLTRHARDGA